MFEFYKVEYLIDETSSFWMNFTITFIGTLMGFLGAFWLLNISDKKQKTNEKKVKDNIYRSQLEYLTLLIESSLSVIDVQISKIEELALKIKNKPTKQQPLEILASNDLERLHKMDSIEMFNAYLAILPENNRLVKDYKNIFNSIDFLHSEMKQIIASTVERNKFVYQNQVDLKSTIDKLLIETKKHIQRIKTSIPNFEDESYYQFLVSKDKIIDELILRKEIDLEIYEKKYLFPYGVVLKKSFITQESYNNLLDLISQSLRTINGMKSDSIEFHDNLMAKRSRLANSINMLNTLNKKMTSNIFTKNPDELS